jgi:serine/threonine protein kinase
MAPELLGESEGDQPVRPSKYSDIYSFGGIMLQVGGTFILCNTMFSFAFRSSLAKFPIITYVKQPSAGPYTTVSSPPDHVIRRSLTVIGNLLKNVGHLYLRIVR